MIRRKLLRRPSVSWGTYAAAILVLVMSMVIVLRYKVALSMPNFYAEDGSVFIHNILEHNMLGATLTAFNGYLVVGQYLVADMAYAIYALFGLPFTHLPFLVAVSSCVFLGLTVSLPFILFRRELGWVVALATSVLLAFTPMPGSDFAVIGTLGNLKFAFLFWAVLFIIYRNIHYRNVKKALFADLILLLCVLTNGPVVALLPFVLWPYRTDIMAILKKRSLNIKLLKRPDVLGVLALLIISAIYVVIVYLKGIPVIPNYLNAPYIWEATDNLIYRVTVYSWLFPVSKEMTDTAVIAVLLIMLGVVFLLNRRGRIVFSFGLIAIAVSTLAFVASRPGVSEFALIYEKFPDQFFYAQSMVFTFITMWVIAPYIRSRRRELLFASFATIFVIVSAPYGSSFGENKVLYEQRGDIYQATSQACRGQAMQSVVIPIYPSEPWAMKVDRNIACK